MITLQIVFWLRKARGAELAWVPLMHILAMSPPPESACFHETSSITEPAKEYPPPCGWLLYSYSSYCSSTAPAPHSGPLPRLFRHTNSIEQALWRSVHSREEQPTRTNTVYVGIFKIKDYIQQQPQACHQAHLNQK